MNPIIKSWIVRGVIAIVTSLLPFLLIIFGAVVIILGSSSSADDGTVVVPPEQETNGIYSYPVPTNKTISSPYGVRIDPITGQPGEFHKGIDFPAPYGTDVVAAADGIVEYAQYNDGGYGYLVKIKHPADNTVTYYAHNSSLKVTVGMEVKKGQKIAEIGSTGNSTGNHCHFEVKLNGQNVDPMPYLENQESEENNEN